MPSVLPGWLVWEYYTPVLTVANSPLLGPWLPTDQFSQIVPSFKFTGGTSVITLDASIDGSTLDTDLTTLYGTLTTGTAVPVVSPYFRVHVVQTVADNTVTKIFVKARA
jgi:hypothetical protein